MRTALITGGAGFVGLNLAEALLARGDQVVIFGREALPAAAQRHFATLPGRLSVTQGDVRDRVALAGLFRAQPIDLLFPFAAITAGPAREAADPHAIIDVNLNAVLATLEAARDAGGVRRVILPSSAAVYGEAAFTHPILDEVTTPVAPLTLYGVTKFAVERAGLRLAGAFGLSAVAARIGATFGPWEHDTGLRDTLSAHHGVVQAVAAGRPALLPPLAAYDWLYVRDLAAGLLALADHPAPPHPVVNLGSGHDFSPDWLAAAEALTTPFPGAVVRAAGRDEAPTIRLNETRPRGVMRVARAADFGWAPRFTPASAYADWAAWLATFRS
jgi:nucleoside-diphosphate-sugar epimerase